VEEQKKLSLINLGGGAAVELFDIELRRVILNVLDPNTQLKMTREINLKIQLKPDDDRESVDILVTCSAKNAPPKTFPTKAYIGKDNSGPIAVEVKRPRQTSIFDKGDNDKIIDLKERG